MLRKIPLEQEKCELPVEDTPKTSNWSKDRGNIILLTFLYVLQGIPLGLAGTVPIMLQSLGVSYKEQAVFSFIYWLFAVKLLWAPTVDSFYLIPAFGIRKSWLLPTHLLGFFVIVLSYNIPNLLGQSEGERINMFALAVHFFILNLLAATQDIAIDGWALTMLSRENVGFASTCNTISQTAGYFIAFTRLSRTTDRIIVMAAVNDSSVQTNPECYTVSDSVGSFVQCCTELNEEVSLATSKIVVITYQVARWDDKLTELVIGKELPIPIYFSNFKDTSK